MKSDNFCTVMPSVFVPEDAAWIQEQMQQLPVPMRQRIAVKYAEVYQQAFDSEGVSYRRENAGRYEANTRLRLFVNNQSRALQGYTAEPPMAGAQTRY